MGRWGIGAILVALLLPLTPSNLMAAPKQPTAPKLLFEDERPATILWDEIDRGVELELCNRGTAPAQGLELELRGFVFRESNRLIETAEVIQLDPAAFTTIKQEECTSFQLEKVSDSEAFPNPGAYPGVIAATAEGAEPVRRELTITGPKLTLAAESFTVDVVHTANPTDDQRLDLEVPLAQNGANAGSQPPEGTEIATTIQGDRQVDLVVAEARSGDALALSLVGAEPGTLTFKSDLLGGLLTMNVRDSICWAIAAITLGLVLGGLPLLWMYRWNLRFVLWKKRKGLVTKYRRAAAHFAKKHKEFKAYTVTDEAVKRYSRESRRALIEYAKAYLFLDPANEDLKAIVKGLDDAEKDADYFGADEGFGAALKQLKQSRDDFVTAFNKNFRLEREPVIIAKASALLTGGVLPVGGATNRGKEADHMATLLLDWRSVAADIKRLTLWAHKLGEKVAMDPKDQERLTRARGNTFEALSKLVRAADNEALESLQARADLLSAYEDLMYLGTKHGVWEPPFEESDEIAEPAQRNLVNFAADLKGIELDKLEVPVPLQQTAGFVVDIFAYSASALMNVGTVLLVIAAAIATGLIQLYFGKTFGTTQDYLAAVLIGLGTPVVTKTILDTISRVRNPLKLTN